MTFDLITFTEIAGAHVYYPPNGLKPRKVRLDRAFHAKLTACLDDLWQRCPWGRADWIGSLGCYVVDPERDTGRHKTGEAIDVARIEWPNGERVDPNDPYQVVRGLTEHYIAVAAVFRLHFQTVLDWWHPDGDGKYRHRDHLHIDTGRGAPTWEKRRNQVRFLQAALNYVWEASPALVIDGGFGPKTRAALAGVPQSMAVIEAGGTAWWPEFLEETARRGFAV